MVIVQSYFYILNVYDNKTTITAPCVTFMMIIHVLN